MNTEQTILTSSPIPPGTLPQVLFRGGVLICIIMVIVAIMGVVRNKEELTIKAVIGLAISVILTVICYGKL